MDREFLFDRGRVSVLQDENGDSLHNSVNVLNLLSCTFKNGYNSKFYVICSYPQLKINLKGKEECFHSP